MKKGLLAFALVISCVAMGRGLPSACAAPNADLATRVTQVDRDGDLDGALALIQELQEAVAKDPSPETYLLLGRACLTVAELRRYAYEKATDMDPRDRRLLGREGDEVARIGHDAMDALPDTMSEKWRIKADLYATMIRSLYKGEKFVNEMDAAMEEALELDPKNPNALLTATKRPLFAEEKHGGDPKKALELIGRVLEIDPNMELAIAFRGVAYEKLGQMDKALADWRRALELNPKSRLALDKLQEHEKK
jgi:tetratricopeptide (TPR) repeat protein